MIAVAMNQEMIKEMTLLEEIMEILLFNIRPKRVSAWKTLIWYELLVVEVMPRSVFLII